MELSVFQEVLRGVASAIKTPVIIILIIFIAFSVFCIGWIIVEALGERRHMNYSVPRLLDMMKSGKAPLSVCIEKSGLLKRQKNALLELTKHPDFDQEMLSGLADNLIEKEQAHYDTILKLTGLVSKLAPMFGLLGTLIPLGPGIIALGQGDTLTLANSMLTAFDTTIAGLIAAGICLVVHTIRSHWYAGYMSDLETLVDAVVDLQKEETESDVMTRTDGARRKIRREIERKPEGRHE